jgi:hypothetical protein
MNDRKIDRVAKAICRAAGIDNVNAGEPCRFCFNEITKQEECEMWPTFRKEAIAALKAAKGF